MLQQWIEITVGGRRRTLSCSLGALLRFERRTGRALYQFGSADRPQALRTLLWALLADDFAAVTEDEIGRMPAAEAAAAFRAAGLLLAASAPVIEADDKPTQPVDEKPLDWYEMWATGRIDLGLSESEFWSLTPAMYHAMCARLEWRLFGHCITAAAVTNVHIDREKSAPLSPLAFMPGKAGRIEARRMAYEQGEMLRAKLGGLRSMLT
jgi:hypothetical protein